MKLDRWIALLFLLGALIYGFAAFNYKLLPFERNMSFLPNTLPMALSVLAAIVSLVILLGPRQPAAETAVLGPEDFRGFKLGQTFGLVAAMVLYALLLRPIGFIIATTAFITGSSVALGERRLFVLVPVALFTAFVVWYLVQETLGIFLRPWPTFFS